MPRVTGGVNAGRVGGMANMERCDAVAVRRMKMAARDRLSGTRYYVRGDGRGQVQQSQGRAKRIAIAALNGCDAADNFPTSPARP